MKYLGYAAAVLLILSQTAAAHEFTPTYPTFKPSYIEGVYSTTMTLFNKRQDVDYYEITVFDKDWNKIPFAMTNRIINIPYLGKKDFDIFIRNKDKPNVEFICSTSKVIKNDTRSTDVTSRICSRVK